MKKCDGVVLQLKLFDIQLGLLLRRKRNALAPLI